MKKTILSKVMICLLVLFSTACVIRPEYKEPTNGPVAKVEFVQAQNFWLMTFDDNQCVREDTKWSERFSPKGTVKVAANAPFRFYWTQNYGQFWCPAMPLSFVPEAGKSYVLSSTLTANENAGFWDYQLNRNLGRCDVVAFEYKNGQKYAPVKLSKIELENHFEWSNFDPKATQCKRVKE